MAAGAPSGSAPGVGADVQIVPDAELTGLNTFGLPARAARLVRVRHADQVQALIGEAGWAVRPRLVLGGGSNLVLSADFAGTVLKVDIPGRRLLRSTQEAWIVEAGAGENWHDFVRWTLAQGWSGLENLALIPGTVGAAPVQNIGASGLELVDRFDSLDAIDLDSGACRCFAVHDCAFGYRDSVFKRNPGKWLVTAVRFRLPRPWQPVTRYADVARELETRGVATPSALDISDAVIAIRRRKLPDPDVLGNAGLLAGQWSLSLFLMFFLYRDGESLTAEVRHGLRLGLGARADNYLDIAQRTSRAVLYGIVLTAIVQGSVAGLGYWGVRLPSPALLTLLTIVMALIPFGAVVVWVLCCLWLFFQGETWRALALLAWGSLIVSWVDNLVRPLVISQATRIPFALVVLGIIGGLLGYGFLGLFLGPVILAIAHAAWEEWLRTRHAPAA